MNASPESVTNRSPHEPDPVDRWLICAPGWLGDTLMALPAVDALRRQHPSVAVTVLCKPALQTLWTLFDAAITPFPLQRGIQGTRRTIAGLRAAECTRAIIFPNSFRSAWLPCMAGIPQRRGFAGHWRRGLLTETVTPPAIDNGRAVHQSLEYAAIADVTLPATSHLLHVPPNYRAEATSRLGDRLKRPLLTVFPGAARGPAKQWPAASFTALCRRWIDATHGNVIIAGSDTERAAAETMAGQLDGHALNLAGRTTLPELAACIDVSAVVVANDSGGAHLAAALDRPLVVIFGQTDPAITAPRGRHVHIVRASTQRVNRRIARRAAAAQAALAAIPIDTVFDAVVAATASTNNGEPS